MKIRLDFVTNSSSSSFITFSITNEKLAEICEKYNIPVSVDGSYIGGTWSAEEGMPIIGTPEFGSIAEWFAEFINPMVNGVYELEDKDFSDAIQYICENKQEIDDSTDRSDIEVVQIETDGFGGNSVSIERRESGHIQCIKVDDYNWDEDETGEPLCETLDNSGGSCETIEEYAENHGLVDERPDPWHKGELDDIDGQSTKEDLEEEEKTVSPTVMVDCDSEEAAEGTGVYEKHEYDKTTDSCSDQKPPEESGDTSILKGYMEHKYMTAGEKATYFVDRMRQFLELGEDIDADTFKALIEQDYEESEGLLEQRHLIVKAAKNVRLEHVFDVMEESNDAEKVLESLSQKLVEANAVYGSDEDMVSVDLEEHKYEDTAARNYYTESALYEISETIQPNTSPLYILMTGSSEGIEEQYETGYRPDSVDDLFYECSIYNGGEYKERSFGRVINGISYDLDMIVDMIPELQKKPLYDEGTKYFVVKVGRLLEELDGCGPWSNALGELKGKCYIVVSGSCDAVDEYLGVFSDLDTAVDYADTVWDLREESIDINILEATTDKVDGSAEFFQSVELEGRSDVLFR